MAREYGNNIGETTTTAGQGSVTLAGAINNSYLTFAEANISDGAEVAYRIDEGDDFEIGIGAYNTAGPTLDRTTVTVSKIGGVAGTSKLTLGGSGANVQLAPQAADYQKLNGIEAAADVTDAANVAAAGALMASGENQGPINGGAEIDPKDHGTQSTGTLIVDVADCPFQEVVNGGPFGLEVGPAYGWTVLDINNNGSAGVITTTTIDKVTGDDFDTTNGNWFRCSLVNGPGGSSLHVQAMQ